MKVTANVFQPALHGAYRMAMTGERARSLPIAAHVGAHAS